MLGMKGENRDSPPCEPPSRRGATRWGGFFLPKFYELTVSFSFFPVLNVMVLEACISKGAPVFG